VINFFNFLKNKFIRKKVLRNSTEGLGHFKNYCESKYNEQGNSGD